LALVSSNWLTHGPAGDVNSDGIVNGQDLALVSSNWLATAGGAGASLAANMTFALSTDVPLVSRIYGPIPKSEISASSDLIAATSTARYAAVATQAFDAGQNSTAFDSAHSAEWSGVYAPPVRSVADEESAQRSFESQQESVSAWRESWNPFPRA
jgi:hypothetical protein